MSSDRATKKRFVNTTMVGLHIQREIGARLLQDGARSSALMNELLASSDHAEWKLPLVRQIFLMIGAASNCQSDHSETVPRGLDGCCVPLQEYPRELLRMRFSRTEGDSPAPIPSPRCLHNAILLDAKGRVIMSRMTL